MAFCYGTLSRLMHASWTLFLSQYMRDQYFNRKVSSFTFIAIIEIWLLILVILKRSSYFLCFPVVSLIQAHDEVWESLC